MSQTGRTDSSARPPERGKRLKTWGAIGVALALISGIIVYLALSDIAPKEDIPGKVEYDFGETIIQGPLFYQPEYNACTDDYRPDYGLSCQWQQFLFGELPGTPADMVEISKGVAENRFVNIHTLGPQYWQNPEFYPGWSQAHVDNTYRTLEENRSTPIGFGSYLFGQGITVRQGSGTKTFVTFLHDGWGIIHWQGMVLSMSLPQVAMNARGGPLLDAAGNPVTQDPEIAVLMNPRFTFDNDPIYEEWASDLVDPLSSEERMVILEPNYPNFKPGRVQRISVEVDTGDLPVVTYFFVIRAGTPTMDILQGYFPEYGFSYMSSGFGVPIFEGIIGGV